MKKRTIMDKQGFIEIMKDAKRSASTMRGYTSINDRISFVLDELDRERPQPYKLSRHINVNP